MKEIIEKDMIENMIYEIRGVQVMLDSDLAVLYECKNGTKTINQAVKRHINKFPERYMFQLTKNEFNSICGPNMGPQKNKARYLPYVFTEQGVAMLATILKTDVADAISMKIIDAFIYMRRYFINSNNILINHENRLLSLENTLDKFKEKELNKIFFEGQMYDAYSLLIDIFNKAQKEIIIIDNYANKELLDILKNINKQIIIVSKNIDNILINKYCKQYNNVKFINNNSFHDRFIIIDRRKLFICGASFKDLGKKCFAISEFDDKNYLDQIINNL